MWYWNSNIYHGIAKTKLMTSGSTGQRLRALEGAIKSILQGDGSNFMRCIDPERRKLRGRRQSRCMAFVLPCTPGAVVVGGDEKVSAVELAMMAS